jgi:signal transduction histidine kinase
MASRPCRSGCESNLPRVTGDMGALHEKLQNLLDNAVRYTQSGGIVSPRLRTAGNLAPLWPSARVIRAKRG